MLVELSEIEDSGTAGSQVQQHPDTYLLRWQVLELLAGGEQHRHFGETKMNTNSSRSHALFRMVRPAPRSPAV